MSEILVLLQGHHCMHTEHGKREVHLPFVEDRNNSSNGLGELDEGRHCEVEVMEGRIAPPAVVVGQCPIGWT
jgi:hypothetical protein